MNEAVYVPDLWKNLLEEVRTGDPNLNKLTQENIDLAYAVAYYTKLAYEIALEHMDAVYKESDPDRQSRLAVYTMEMFNIANKRAAIAAEEFSKN